MKKFVLLLWLFASIARASSWQVAGFGEGVTVYVDSNSIVKSGKYKKAWIKYSYTDYRDGAPVTNFKKYRSFTMLNLIFCDERKSGTMQTTYYDGEVGMGQVVGGVDLAFNQVQFYEVAPDTLGESVLDFVCKKTTGKQ